MYKRTIPAIYILCCWLTLSCSINSPAGQFYNLDFEQLNKDHLPEKWQFRQDQDGYVARTDSGIHKHGKYAVSIEKTGKSGTFGVCTANIPPPQRDGRLQLTGYLRTKDVDSGYAGLWLRIDGAGYVLAFDNMHQHGISGTTNWKAYTITLSLDAEHAKNIAFGCLLTGKGKVWVDDLRLTVDGKPVEQLPVKTPDSMDSLSVNGSGITAIALKSGGIERLTNLGMLWGFLKYYHPAVESGTYIWDAELFRVLPGILNAADNNAANRYMEQWVDSLGPVADCDTCSAILSSRMKMQPDFSYLFTPGNLPASLVKKLVAIRDHHPKVIKHYYVSLEPNKGNPVFTHEIAYYHTAYPDAGVRLLALYRYWNMIRYYFPYRYLISEDWNKTLTTFIPRFINACDRFEYLQVCLELIAKVQDSHANIWGNNRVLDSLKGLNIMPFEAKFIEGRLVVTGFYTDAEKMNGSLQTGDIIESIDNMPVTALVKKYLPLTPASNYEKQLNDLPSTNGFLLRSNQVPATLQVNRKGVKKTLTVNRIRLSSHDISEYYRKLRTKAGYKMLDQQIGYIYPGSLKKEDIQAISRLFRNTKGLIIDLRCYPATFMPFTYGAWLKGRRSPFVQYALCSLETPGATFYHQPALNGGVYTDANGAPLPHYPGNRKVVIIVDATTISQAEFTAMALSTAPGAVVIGSQTAGADGDVSHITLPGDINTSISGIGIYYPDNTETQQKGVKIDILVKPTIKGIQAGRDELLDKAIHIIQQG